MAIDKINFSITCGGEESARKKAVLERINKTRSIENQGKSGLTVNEKQKKHVKTKR